MEEETQSTQSTPESLRADLKSIGAELILLKKFFIEHPLEDKELQGEVVANTVLAFRHVEDAAMRLGKVLQAVNGGQSIYDNSGVVGQK